MKINVYHVETNDYGRIISPNIAPHGYIELPVFDADKCWHLCNWFHWSREKPKNVHSDIDSCNHGLIVYNSQTKEYWLALSKGWINGNAAKIRSYVNRNWSKTFWNKDEIDEVPELNGERIY